MKKFIILSAAFATVLGMYSCKKDSQENVQISEPEFQTGQTISSDTLIGSVKGTLLSGKTYYFNDVVTINEGDTLLMQSDVKLLSLSPDALLQVKGTFISLGTKEKPNWITGVDAFNNPSAYKHTDPNEDPNVDPAFKPSGKLWGGIQCAETCPMLNIKWTHLDFAGGNNGSNPLPGYKQGDDLFVILFQNPDGYLILEDSWIYGSTTDATRVKGGHIHIMRNTVEKLAYNDGDCFNVKSSTDGDMAYNLIIGTAKGGTKASNKGGGARQTHINMYNNTYINGGWRSVDPDRGANLNYEEGARGYAYNNIMVNCKTGLRILENPIADTANIRYGNNLTYGDSLSVVNEIYPLGHITMPQATDIPDPASFYPGYPNNFTPGQAYSAPGIVGKNNPMFVNYPLPQTAKHLRDITFQGTFDFHLQASSPAIGKGFVGFTPLNTTAPVDNKYLKATVTPPNQDLGAFPTDGSGNQHR